MASAGSTVTTATRARMSSRSARRNRNMSGLRPVTSSTGWAIVSPVNANSSANDQRPAPDRPDGDTSIARRDAIR
jgi:hypothetical protein